MEKELDMHTNNVEIKDIKEDEQTLNKNKLSIMKEKYNQLLLNFINFTSV